jgi:biotin operon repressor
LRRARLWLTWQLRDGRKVPYYADGTPRRGELDSPEDRARLVTYAEARKAGQPGLAIVPGYVFIDLDGHAPGGVPDAYAQGWIDACPGALVELSQSGNGLHIIGRWKGEPITITNKDEGLEIYTGKRFCAWTGAIVVAPRKLPDLTRAVSERLGLPALGRPLRPGRAQAAPERGWSGERWDARNTRRAVERLQELDPGCSRDDWLRTLMAIHDGTHGDDEGLEIAIAWSSGQLWDGRPPPNYAGERDVRVVWGSLRPPGARRSSGPAVTKASLFAGPTKAPTGPTTKFQPLAPPTGSLNGAGLDISELLGSEPPAPVEWRVQNMLGPGAYLLVARPKCGKSYLCLQLAKAVAAGVPFLGSPTRQAHVAYFATEDNLGRIHRRVLETQTQAGLAGVHIVVHEHLVTLAQAWARQPEETRGAGEGDDWLRQWLGEHPQVKLVLLDTQESFEATLRLEADAQDERSVTRGPYRRMRLYENLARELGITIVLVNHTRKRNGREITDFHELINMSQTAVAGTSGSIVLADHPERDAYADDPRRVLAVRGRDIDHDYVLALDRVEDGSGFRSLGEYHVVAQTTKQAELLEIVESVQEGDAFVPLTVLAEEMSITKRAVRALIQRMRRDQRAEWRGRRVETKPGRGGGVRLI